jgi:hypothetical protein
MLQHCTAAAAYLLSLAVDRYNMITGEHIEFMAMRNEMFQVWGVTPAARTVV